MTSRKALVRAAVILGIVSFVFLAGCRGGAAATNNLPPPDPLKAITVSVSPANALVQIGMSQQFTAIVQNDPTNRGVSWIIGNATCQPADCETIDTTGKYTAPRAQRSQAKSNLNKEFQQ